MSTLLIKKVFSNNDDGLINKKLPKELLLRIFSFLDIVTLCRCAQISKAWNILALDGSNWQRIDLFNFQTDVERITDDGVVQICRGCHRLQALCLSGCSNLTDASLTALGLNCPRLQILEAARCSHLTDAGFTLLARNCHDLEKMDLEECVLITDSTLIQLSIHCPKLQALSLSHCELITDEGILHLSSSTCGHERLRVLELDNCLLVTDAALEHLENCRGLERLELYDCQQVTRAGIKRMRAQLPHVKVHAYFAPVTPPPAVAGSGHRLCRCCVIL
ncbi:F-box/LRR-repeat protein 2 [Cricetulus griseus]|nr:F-box/LRR-repeat protein 2 [Cricetulus griseus]